MDLSFAIPVSIAAYNLVKSYNSLGKNNVSIFVSKLICMKKSEIIYQEN